MEKEIKIKTPDKKIIYGTFSSSKKASKKLVIFIHGFKGYKDHHTSFNGSKFFNQHGFDAFRFDLYTMENGGRFFEDTSISIHGKDITTVVKHFRNKYKKIFVIGHSYGGTSLLFIDQKLVDRFVFWDASYIKSTNDLTEDGELVFNKSLGAYILDWGNRFIVGKKFVDELHHFPDCGKLISKIHKPVLFITAEKANLKAGREYFIMANEPKKLINIKGADHNFNNFKTEYELLKQTLSWIKKY